MQDDRLRGLIILAAIILGVITGSSLYAGQKFTIQTYPRGTFIAGNDVSGLSKARAALAMEKKYGPFSDLEYTFSCLNASCRVKSSEIGATADWSTFLDQVLKQEGQRTLLDRLINWQRRDYPLKIKLRYKRSQYNLGMERVCMALDKPARGSRIKWDVSGNPTVIPGEDGEKIDIYSTFKILPAVYTGEKGLTVRAVTKTESIRIDEDTLSRQVPIASFSTSFNPGNVNRTFNLRLAASALDGVIIPAGREFSYNAAVGPRDFSTGYKEAMIIVKNEFTPGVGGGICQVSSTLYNAALLANLPVTERHNHSIIVPYLPPGLDATVSSAKDLRFINNTSGPICIRVSASGSTLKISLLGLPRDPVSVKIEREVSKTVPFQEIRKPDPELAMGQQRVDHQGSNGYYVKCYRLIYGADGKLLERQLLSSDVYKPLAKLVLVGTKVLVPAQQAPAQIPVQPEEPSAEPPVVSPDQGSNSDIHPIPSEEPTQPANEPVPPSTEGIGG